MMKFLILKRAPLQIELEVFTAVQEVGGGGGGLGQEKFQLDDLIDFMTDRERVVWEYGWKCDDKGKEVENSASIFEFEKSDTNDDSSEGTGNPYFSKKIILFNKNSVRKENNKVKVNGIEKHWIRCRVLKDPFYTELEQFEIGRFPLIHGIIAKVFIDGTFAEKPGEGVSDGTIGGNGAGNGIDNGGGNSADHGSVVPDKLFYKDVPIDVLNDAEKYPFGKQPFTYDIFYIGSNDCFSKKNADITITFEGFNAVHFMGNLPPIDGKNSPILSWEYWNGKGWDLIKVDPNAITANSLKFRCPIDISPTNIHGFENYWIRVRITSGDYGKGDVTITSKQPEPPDISKQTVTWNTDVIKPPKFTKILIGINYNEVTPANLGGGSGSLQENEILDESNKFVSPFCMTFNNLNYKVFTDQNNKIISPFIPFTKFLDYEDNLSVRANRDHSEKKPLEILTSPSLNFYTKKLEQITHNNCNAYFGFNGKLESGPYHLYFSIIENKEVPEHIQKGLNFYYCGDSGWKRLFVKDGTNYFTQRGTIKLFLPSDFKKQHLFGKDLFWIKVEDTNNLFDSKFNVIPNIRGIYLNTAVCTNSSLIRDELITVEENDGTDFAKYRVYNKPILSFAENVTFENGNGDNVDGEVDGDGDDGNGQPYQSAEEVWVREKQKLSLTDRNFLQNNKRLIEGKDPLGNILETWVKWSDAESVTVDSVTRNAAATYRNYSLDRIEGLITLGPAFESSLKSIILYDYKKGGKISYKECFWRQQI